ncbi:MAG: ACP S-malonyltransferase [Burkholderiales bacterium]
MKAAFVFPGQGSQSVGMMRSVLHLPRVRETFEEASAALGLDLWNLVENGPEDKLNETVNTQPVMLCAGVAMYRAWESLGGRLPALLAGHSLGEYSALVAGNAIRFDVAVRLVQFRAQAMQEAVPAGVGAIAAIVGLDDDVVRAVCLEASSGQEIVEAANYNSPAQTVIAGHKAAVDRGMKLAKQKGAKRAILLPMSVPSHCALMRSAAERLKMRLADIPLASASIPVVHNADVSISTSASAIKESLYRQLFQPVRWVEVVRTLATMGATHIVECGPGRVLAGLNKRIVPDAKILTFADAANFDEALAMLAGEKDQEHA